MFPTELLDVFVLCFVPSPPLLMSVLFHEHKRRGVFVVCFLYVLEICIISVCLYFAFIIELSIFSISFFSRLLHFFLIFVESIVYTHLE